MLAKRIGLAALLALLVAVPAPLVAKAKSNAPPQVRKLFRAGKAAYEKGDFATALAHFEQADALIQKHPDPDRATVGTLLYNIGTAADRLRHNERALAAFEQYLLLTPNAKDAPQVRARIAVLERVIAEEDAKARRAAAPPPALIAPAAASPAPQPGIRWAPWLVTGAGVALAATGAALLMVAANERSTVEGAPEGSDWSDFSGAADRAQAFEIAGWTTLGVGIASLGVGIVWLLIGDAEAAPASVAWGPNGIVWRGDW